MAIRAPDGANNKNGIGGSEFDQLFEITNTVLVDQSYVTDRARD